MDGAAANDVFGYSVSSAGDVNGDGYSDVIIGAYQNDAGGGNAGRAYLYFSSPPPLKPGFYYAKDVTGDQGGKVMLKWTKSREDIPSVNTITGYLIERSAPPVNGLFSWEPLTTIAATFNHSYSYTATTPNDSGATTTALYYYRITARTSSNLIYYRSEIKSAYSVDNLAPLYVRSLMATDLSGKNKLTWSRNTESDLKDYVIYRNNINFININSATPYAIVTDSVFVDNTPLTGESYYFICARDIHGNLSTPSSIRAINICINLTLFIEGLFNGSQNSINDSVFAILKGINPPYNTEDFCKAPIDTAGNAVLRFYNAPSGNYYLVITYRNGIETWSKVGGEAMTRGSSVSYNFTTSASQAYGSNMIQKGTKWCIYSGDVNQDGQISLDDLLLIDVDNQNFATGYLVTDINGDGQVTLDDLLITDTNNQNFVSVQKPGGKILLKQVKKTIEKEQ